MSETSVTTRRTPLRTAWRWIASVQVRLLLSLGLVLGFAAVGTSAYWADNATFTTGTIEAGSLDLQLGGRNPLPPHEVVWSAVGLNQDWNYSVMQLDNVSPGESVAMELHIRNVGSTPLTFTGVGTSTTNSFWSGGEGFLVAKTMLGGVAANSGTREAVNRTGTCTGGTMWWGQDTATLWTGNPHQLSTTPRVITPGNAPVALAPNQAIQVCILAGLDLDAPNSIQSASTTVRVALEAKQIGAP